MADPLASHQRSSLMSRIRSKHTKPEMTVRRGLHSRGLRYQLHPKMDFGKPDIFLPKWRTAVLVNGCFWHGHDCHLFQWPKSREEFWREKIGRNRERDKRMITALMEKGYFTALVWECGIRNTERAHLELEFNRLAAWIRDPGGPRIIDISAETLSLY